MEASGPVKLSDVEAAQKEVAKTAKKLADDGELMSVRRQRLCLKQRQSDGSLGS